MKGFNWSEERANEHNRKVARMRSKGRGASTVPEDESVHEHADETEDGFAKSIPQVIVRFTHRTRRLADADAYIGKWFLDGLVEAGILRDDSPQYVQEVRHRQVKIEQWEEEQTIIELIAVEIAA